MYESRTLSKLYHLSELRTIVDSAQATTNCDILVAWQDDMQDVRSWIMKSAPPGSMAVPYIFDAVITKQDLTVRAR
jgi:hypothetical protein